MVDAAGTTVYDINGLDKAAGTLYQLTQAGQIVPARSVGTPVPIPAAWIPVTANTGGASITASFDALNNPGSARLNHSCHALHRYSRAGRAPLDRVRLGARHRRVADVGLLELSLPDRPWLPGGNCPRTLPPTAGFCHSGETR
jgi:hypothetical protein